MPRFSSIYKASNDTLTCNRNKMIKLNLGELILNSHAQSQVYRKKPHKHTLKKNR